MKRKTLYNFNYVQLTFNQCVFNRIQYRTEQIVYSTRLDNSTGNSALQFRLHFVLTISSDEFVLTNSTYNWPYNVGWPKWVKRSEPPSSDSTVVQSGCLVSRPSLADVSRIDARMGRVTRGKDSFWWHFSVDISFPLWTYPRGPTRPHWTKTAGAGGFIPTSADLFMCTCAYACIYQLLAI